jgi:hypothetical protein
MMSVYQADYPGRAACEEHWAKVRADIVAGNAVSAPAQTKTLAEQADDQLSRLRREMAEWQAIKNGASA